MKLPLLLLLVSSLFTLGCGTIPRPDSNIGIVNAPNHYLLYYNMRSDFDSNGNLSTTALAKYLPVTAVTDLNKYVCLDPTSFANLKAYLIELRNKANGN